MNKIVNLFLSLSLHALVMLIVFVFASIVPAPRVIAPDRIKITEIDLRNVKITGLETKVQNRESLAVNRDFGNDSHPGLRRGDVPNPVTIKVNREVMTLDRTMTVSIIDAFRIAMTRCWQIDSPRPDFEGMRVVAHMRLYPNGRVQNYWFEQASMADTDITFAYVLDSIRMAIEACQPFSMLPRNEFEKWKTVQLTFFPMAKIVE